MAPGKMPEATGSGREVKSGASREIQSGDVETRRPASLGCLKRFRGFRAFRLRVGNLARRLAEADDRPARVSVMHERKCIGPGVVTGRVGRTLGVRDQAEGDIGNYQAFPF